MARAPAIYVVSAARTAIGSFGGSLRDLPPTHLATTVVRAALDRAAVHPTWVKQVMMGQVIATEPRDAYLSRIAAIEAGIPPESVAFNVNRLCGSGLHAVLLAAQSIACGDTEMAVGGGAESMSRSPYLLPNARWGMRMGDGPVVDYMLGILHDPFHRIHMGITAENVAQREGVSRDQQDRLALESQRRAALALQEGRFTSQLVPVEVRLNKDVLQFSTDENVRAGTTLEQLAKMKPAFKPDGSVTAGNSSGINDGAAALVLASEPAIQAHGLKPIARLVSSGHAGVDPQLMGLGPVPASKQALQRAGLTVRDLDVIESNEAFAAQACAVAQALEFDPAKVNPNGSGIALGHPVGATGAILATKAIHELQRIGGRYALATMCIGGGQGIAVVFERT